MRRLVVGIDYGTSNSGVAYALFNDDDGLNPDGVHISVIKDLAKGRSGQNSAEKLPSDIAYNSQWQPIGQGYDIPNTASALQWVKLLLEPNGLRGKRGTQRVWRTYEALGSHKKPVEVVADYLHWLWTRTKACIIRNLDEEDVVDKSDVTVVLTIPAFWSERAKQGMIKAAELAGITAEAQVIRLVPEAEAAAIFGLAWQAQNTTVRNEDCVIVCDAGGGTVDLVSYQVLQRNPLEIDQRTTPKGSFCGSVFIDLEFENQLRSILGEETFDNLDREARSRIGDKFEHEIKRTYSQTSQDSGHFSIPLPENQEHVVEANVVDQCFQAIMTPIETLIDDQFDQLREKQLDGKIRGILLVGGLSRSDYVYNRIRDGYGSKDMKIWRADDPWTAVAQGAVFCETSAVIHSRLAKHNYGIPYRDAQGDRKVHWIVKKGESVKSNMPTEPYALRIDEKPWLDNDDYFHLFVTLVRSDEDNATSDFSQARVRPHAIIDCRLPTAIRFSSTATLVQKDPTKAWHIPATFVPVLNGAVISFRCKVSSEEVGITELDYFDDDANPHQDFHPDRNSMSITRAPTRSDTGEGDGSFRILPTSSSGGHSERKIREWHFNTRVGRDAPKEARPKAGTLPGMFVRGWIPRDDFYVDNDEES